MRPRGRILFGRTAGDLQQIAEPDVALVLWRRVLPPALKTALEHSDLSALPGGRIACRAGAVGQAVRALLQGQPLAPLLAPDVARLAWRFALACGGGWLRVRLEAVRGDGCRLFHADHVPVRLVTTYRGPGTQYLPPAAVSLGRQGARLDLARMRWLAPGSVALFKGMTAGPAAPVILHRSPPLEGTGETRLLLVIDRADPP